MKKTVGVLLNQFALVLQPDVCRRVSENAVEFCDGLIDMALCDAAIFHQNDLGLLCAGTLHFPVLRVINSDRCAKVFFFGLADQNLAVGIALRIIVKEVTFYNDFDLPAAFLLVNFIVNHELSFKY